MSLIGSVYAVDCLLVDSCEDYLIIMMCAADRVCYVGDRLLAKAEAYSKEQNKWQCNNNETSHLYFLYCRNLSVEMESADPDCVYFRSHPVGLHRGIPGLPSGVFYSKLALVIIVNCPC